jgi:photosystem II stability/assembly factor-like uncharacterized protein
VTVDPDDELRRLLRDRLAPLDPPPGTFERISRRARRRRTARTTLAVTTTGVVVVGVAVAGLVVGRQLSTAPSGRPTALHPLAGSSGPAPHRYLGWRAIVRTASARPSPTPPSAPPTPAGGPVPQQLSLVNLTWVSSGLGWALGTTPCTNPSCTSIVRTSDGGRSWVGIPAPHARLGTPGLPGCTGSEPCVSQLRFADPLDGYAFGPSLYSTDNGGATWVRRQPGGSVHALEPGAGTVIAVVGGTAATCRPGCQVLAGGVDPTGWRPAGLTVHATSVQLARAGADDAGLLAVDPTGSSPTVFLSRDAGHHWSPLADPCRSGGRATTLTLGTDGSFVVLCQAGRSRWVVSAPPGSRHFGTAHLLPGLAPMCLVSPRAGLLVAAGRARVLASTDGGRRWTDVLLPPAAGTQQGSPTVPFVGFETGRVGRMIAAGRFVYSTSDGGRHWYLVHRFG